MSNMKKTNVAVARTVQARGSTIAPMRTGKLAGSLRPSKQVAKAVVRSNLIYAGPIHWGWPRRGIKAQPFLVTAAEETRPEWLDEYEKALQAIVNKIHGA